MILLDISTFLGRMHPMVVHLPIGFLLLAVIFDSVSYHNKYLHLNRAVPFTLLIGFASAVAACVLGYILSLTGDYDNQTLSNHKISGILLALLAGILFVLSTPLVKRIILIPPPLFSCLSVATLFLLTYAGHLGANLTHGSNFVTLETLMRQEREKPTTVDDALIFEDIIYPILEQRCFQCHQDGRRKGRLSMESLASMMKGGKHGPSVVPGNLSESELFRRITLDASHEEFMPPDGKTPLTRAETEIIRWWIEKTMAVQEKRISELEGHEEISGFASSILKLDGLTLEENNFSDGQRINENIPPTLDMLLVENLRNKGLVVRVMLQKPVMLDVTVPSRSGIQVKDIIGDLERVALNIVWLNLSDNGFTENDLGILKQMSNVEKLRLEGNPVSDGLGDLLGDLKNLEVVNLSETKITNACVTRLQQNPTIKRIYTWKTSCDSINYLTPYVDTN